MTENVAKKSEKTQERDFDGLVQTNSPSHGPFRRPHPHFTRRPELDSTGPTSGSYAPRPAPFNPQGFHRHNLRPIASCPFLHFVARSCALKEFSRAFGPQISFLVVTPRKTGESQSCVVHTADWRN